MGDRTMTSLMTSFVRHPFLAFMMFLAGYFMTITVRANAQDTIVTGDTIKLQENEGALITGKITEVKDSYFDMESNGKLLRIFLKDVDMRDKADKVFSAGMHVTVKGELKGEEFGRTNVRAESVVASATPTATILVDPETRDHDD